MRMRIRLMKCLGQRHLNGLSIVLYKLIACMPVEIKRPGMSRAYPADDKYPLLQHPGKTAFPLPDRQELPSVIVADGNQAVSSFFVSIALAIIFIQVKLTIGTGVYLQYNGVGRPLIRIFHFRAQRQDTARFHEHRNMVVGG